MRNIKEKMTTQANQGRSSRLKVIAVMGKKSFDKPREQILHWVQRLERVNASLDSDEPEVAVDSGKGACQPTGLTSSRNVDPDELCFKTAQLITELLLILFAACLLLVAAIVVFSKKIPSIMESYEVIPKGLFFMCIIVAVYSFFRWFAFKLHAKFQHPTENENKLNPKVSDTTRNPEDILIVSGRQQKAMTEAGGNLKSEEETRLLEEPPPAAVQRPCQPVKSYLLIKNPTNSSTTTTTTTANSIIHEESSS